MPKVICVTGTPGTGKSTLTRRLSYALRYEYIDLSEKVNDLAESFDEERKCWVVDTDKLEEEVSLLVEKYDDPVIIDSHLSHDLPADMVDLVIVTVCEIEVLRSRLQERGYDEKKVEENVQAEIFRVCAEEAQEKGHSLMLVDTTKGIKEDEVVQQVRGMLD